MSGTKLINWSLLRAKFHPHRCKGKGIGPPKLKFLLRFDQNVEYRRPAGAYPFRDFHKLQNLYLVSECVSCQNFIGFAQGVVELWGF